MNVIGEGTPLLIHIGRYREVRDYARPRTGKKKDGHK